MNGTPAHRRRPRLDNETEFVRLGKPNGSLKQITSIHGWRGERRPLLSLQFSVCSFQFGAGTIITTAQLRAFNFQCRMKDLLLCGLAIPKVEKP
jgi:hypothetical protein